MTEELICFLFTWQKNLFVFSFHDRRTYLFALFMTEELICFLFSWQKNLFVFSFHDRGQTDPGHRAEGEDHPVEAGTEDQQTEESAVEQPQSSTYISVVLIFTSSQSFFLFIFYPFILAFCQNFHLFFSSPFPVVPPSFSSSYSTLPLFLLLFISCSPFQVLLSYTPFIHILPFKRCSFPARPPYLLFFLSDFSSFQLFIHLLFLLPFLLFLCFSSLWLLFPSLSLFFVLILYLKPLLICFHNIEHIPSELFWERV